MKRIFLISAICLLTLLSCKKENSNPLIGTKWTSPDALAKIIFGGVCTTSVEFLNETGCQQINDYAGSMTVKQGSYVQFGDSVKWTVESTTIRGKISGSIIQTNYWDLGTNRIYTKQ